MSTISAVKAKVRSRLRSLSWVSSVTSIGYCSSIIATVLSRMRSTMKLWKEGLSTSACTA